MSNRKRILMVIIVAAVTSNMYTASTFAQNKKVELKYDYNVKPVPFNHVHVNDNFWTPRLEINRKVTIPYAFKKCEETGRIRNFEKAAGLLEGKHEGIYFNDSDVYKIMEGAAYSLRVYPNTMMRLYLDKLITIMSAAQWEDGYLFTFYSVPDRQPEKLWTNIESIHEQYCVGHMYEAAVAHNQVTGEKPFLNIAVKNADLICNTFNSNKRTDPPGHQEIEIGLCKLYRATGDEKYLRQAKFFLDQRGRKGNRGPNGNGGLYGQYSQDHKPVTEQTRALGHSVRAAYLYTGMADVAALTGDMKYVGAIDAIWKDVVETKLYITGGIGAAGGHEGFGSAYELPNMIAYCETCASIANIFWNHRMFLMHNDAKYIDVLERVLYNAALSGISMKGDLFFYPNPLQSKGQHARSPWFGCACCPSNVARFIPSVPGYVYAYKNDDIYINLFISGRSIIETNNNKIKLTQKTEYPWDGEVQFSVEPDKSDTFTINIRIPGWARNQAVPSDLYQFQKNKNEKTIIKVNGERIAFDIQKGFAGINRKWHKGDTIELNLPMAVHRIIAHPNVKEDKDKFALQRGPIIYCLEWPDNDGKVLNLMIRDSALLRTEYKPDLLNGVMVITGNARVVKGTKNGEISPARNKQFVAIPYYAWAHRGRGEMTVWPARKASAALPEPADTLTYRSKTTASFVHASLDAIKDQILPKNSSDSSALQLDFWPHKGTTEWIQFDWNEKHNISSVQIYWFDDTGRGQCSVPKSWKVLYRDSKGNFKPVQNNSPYLTKTDTFNKVNFEPVNTNSIKIEIILKDRLSAGVQEVIIN